MAKRRVYKMSDQLRRAIDECGVTRYRIAQETGISESHLALFYAGKRGMSLATLDKLALFLELRLVTDRKPKKDER